MPALCSWAGEDAHTHRHTHARTQRVSVWSKPRRAHAMSLLLHEPFIVLCVMR